MNRYNRSGISTLFLLGGYLVWRNRFSIQRFFARSGINIPLLSTGSVSETLGSSLSKATGSVEHGVSSVGQDIRSA